ncbi:MAG: HlyD family secretion protein [Opitutales bacterium]
MNSTAEKPVRTTSPVSPADPSPAHKPHRGRGPRRYAKPALITILSLAIVGWLGHLAWHAYRYEDTDDAYVSGHLDQVSALVDGQVQAVRFDDNQTVRAGQVLVELDPLPFAIAVQKAEAGVAQARAQQTEAAAAIRQTEAQLTTAEARANQADAELSQSAAQLDLARLTLQRTETLLRNGGATTQADVDNARSNFATLQAAQGAAQANLAATRASINSAEAARAAAHAQAIGAQANLAAAEASRRDALREQTYARIVAPAAGRVGNRNVEIGNQVKAGQTLLALVEPDCWIVANFKETQLARMRQGQPVDLTFDALPGRTYRGTIDSLSPASGAQFALLPPDNATGNFNKVVQRVPVKIVLDAATLAALGDRLRLGLSVIVSVRVR